MLPALAQVSTLNASFEQDLDDYASAHCPAIEVWLTKLETYLGKHSLENLKQLLSDTRLSLPVASYQGGILSSQGEARREAWELFGRRLDLCQAAGIGTLVVAGDIAPLTGQDDLDRVRVSLKQAALEAERRRVRLAVEFQSRAGFMTNLATAAALVGEVRSPWLGLCLDVFHYYVGPSKPEDLAALTPANLFHVQLCDLAGVPREFAADRDRILPGDGDIGLGPLIEHLRRIDYRGHVSIELMNPQIWQVKPLSFAEIAMTALRKALGQASM